MANHKHENNYYWCADCQDWNFCDLKSDDTSKNEIYVRNNGRVDGVCKIHRLARNQKYRPLKKGKRLKKVKQEKNLRQTYKEIGRSKLSGIDRGHIEGWKEFWSQNQLYFKDTFNINYTKKTAEKAFEGVMGG